MSEDEREKLGKGTKSLRHYANQYDPPDLHPAELLSWENLLRMMKCSEIMKLSYNERLVQDVLIVAFSTVSRCAEVLTLRVCDVSEAGDNSWRVGLSPQVRGRFRLCTTFQDIISQAQRRNKEQKRAKSQQKPSRLPQHFEG